METGALHLWERVLQHQFGIGDEVITLTNAGGVSFHSAKVLRMKVGFSQLATPITSLTLCVAVGVIPARAVD